MLSIIWKSMTKRRFQSLSILISVAISVGVLFSFFLLYLGVSKGLATDKERLGADILVVPNDARIEPESAMFNGAPLNVYMQKNYLGEIARIPGVRRITPQFFTQTLNEDCCSLGEAVRLIGFDPGSDWVVNSWLQKRQSEVLGADEVLIGARVRGYQGDQALILGSKFKVAAVLEPTGSSLDYSVMVTMDSARRLAKENSRFDNIWRENGPPEDLVSALLVEIDDGYPKENTIHAIEGMGGIKVISTSEVVKRVGEQMNTVFLFTLIGGVLMGVSSLLNMFSHLFSLSWNRKGEWGLYRALGATRSDLRMLVMGEALITVLAGALLGVPVGIYLYYLTLVFLQRQNPFPFIDPSVSYWILGAVGMISVFSALGLISAWIPASKAAKIDPSLVMAIDEI